MKNHNMLRTVFLLATTVLLPIVANAADPISGKVLYEGSCSACHSTGAAGAPKLGDVAAWEPRIKAGAAVLLANTIKGKGIMPARGGNPKLTDAEVQAAVNYMISQSGSGAAAAAKSAAPAPAVARPAAPPPVTAKPAAAPPAGAAAAPAAAAVVSVPVPVPGATPGGAAAATANTFNRLMRPAAQRNLPPWEDGIHDPTSEGTLSLQPPRTAFAPLAKSNDGNRVDWVKALNDKSISPRFDRNDPNVAPMVMDMNIVREVKGSMPDVVFPHKQHTQWLDCANCHPAIFIPQKGANQISMASILLGQKCGVCHGKVAFPVSDCRRCHLQSKAPAAKTDVKQ